MEVGWLTGCLGGRLVEKPRVSPALLDSTCLAWVAVPNPWCPPSCCPSSVQKCQYLGEVGFPVSWVPSG